MLKAVHALSLVAGTVFHLRATNVNAQPITGGRGCGNAAWSRLASVPLAISLVAVAAVALVSLVRHDAGG